MNVANLLKELHQYNKKVIALAIGLMLAVFIQISFAQPVSAANYGISMCKSFHSSAYGGIWRVTAIFTKPVSANKHYRITNLRTNEQKRGTQWWGNEVAALDILASQALNDEIRATIDSTNGSYYRGLNNRVNYLPNCN